MKKCPKCKNVYDDKLNFCLQDGTPLFEQIEDSTEVETQVGVVYPNIKDELKTQELVNKPKENELPPTYFEIPLTSDVANPAPQQVQPLTPNSNLSSQKNPVNYILLGVLFLIIGLIGGGGLFWLLSGNSATSDTAQTTNTKNEKPTPTAVEENQTNSTENENSLDTADSETVDNSDDETSDDADDSGESVANEQVETPTPNTPKTCFLSDGGKGGGEVNVRRYCDNSAYDCSKDSVTIAGSFANQTPIKKLGSSVRSGNFTWVKISLESKVYWVAASKIRCQ
jgi:hypothetical protein